MFLISSSEWSPEQNKCINLYLQNIYITKYILQNIYQFEPFYNIENGDINLAQR